MKDIEKTGSAIVEYSRGKYFPCETFRDASWRVRQHIQGNGLGASEWTGSGKVLHPTKGEIAHVSYNGRVWDNAGKEITDLRSIIQL